MSINKWLLCTGGISLCVLLVAYSNHFNNEFHFDDSHTIVNNIYIRTLSNIPDFFVDPSMFSADPAHQALRPLVTSSLAIDYWLAGGLHSWMFLLSTFLWHIGLCIMLFFVYRRLLSRFSHNRWVPLVALFGASWFAVHTVMAETLNYIIARSDVLSTFFIVASFFIFMAWPRQRKFLLYLLPAIFGIFAKETIPVLPVLLFFYIILFEKQLSVRDLFVRKNFRSISSAILLLLPCIFIIGAVQWYVLSKTISSSFSSHIPYPLGRYLLTQPYVWFRYFRSFFLPYDLSADTDMEVVTGLTDLRVFTGMVFLILLIVAIFRTSRIAEMRPISFGLIWFAVSLLPTSVVPLSEVTNDHRMYFAFVGLTLSVVASLALLVIKKQHYFQKQNRYKWLLAGAFLIISANAFGVYQRNKIWRTEESLWKDVTEKSPLSARGWTIYGRALLGSYDIEAALAAHKKAEAIAPGYSFVYTNKGLAYVALGDSAAAVQNFTKAISLSPDEYYSYIDLARYYLEKGDFLKAKNLAEKALSLNANSYSARDIVMGAYQGLGMWKELEQVAQSTLAIVPGDAKAMQYLRAGQEKKVLVLSTYSYSNLPSVETLIALSLKQYNDGRYEDCIKTCYRILKDNPGNADAYNNICAANNMLKRWEEAKIACAKALELNPGHPNAPANLKWAENRKP